jgi:enoyl-CoA hydratase/carnithine racemase
VFQLTEAVRYERDGDLAIVTLTNGPLNLYGAATSQGLSDGIERAESEGARALLYRAEGKFFSAGVDVHSFATNDTPLGGSSARNTAGLVAQRFEGASIPTIAAVHGLCLTAAFEAALGCDLIIAARSAKFGLIEATIGLTPLAGGTERIALRAGVARAYEIVMFGDRYDAQTLERWNVINQVFDDEEFTSEAVRYAQRLANGPTLAFAATKKVVREFVAGGVVAADAKLAEYTAPLRQTEDHQNAIKTFFEQGPGKAVFTGR